MIHLIKQFILPDDLKTVQDYIKTIKFNTKEDHVPLHNELFEKNNVVFDLHTRGEMPKHILEIFSKYSRGYYENVQKIENEQYHPPMFSKHYIARYKPGACLGPQFDPEKPQGTYKSYIYWNDDFGGGSMSFPGWDKNFNLEPGDLIFFVENEENRYRINTVEDKPLFLSEAWMGRVGQAWMPGVDYNSTNWDDWEIKGF
jgi:hypothetical protein